MQDATIRSAPNDTSTTYVFNVVIEPDDDAWHAYCPALQGYGAVTWGRTRDEALRHIREVVEMVVAELRDEGEAVPTETGVPEEPRVTVTV